MSHSITDIFSFNSQFDWYFNNISSTTRIRDKTRWYMCISISKYISNPRQIIHSSNGFYLRFIKENTQSHKQRCSWASLMLLWPERISYFISKWDIKKHFLNFFTQVLWNKTTIFTRLGIAVKKLDTAFLIFSFLLTTGFPSWITKKSMYQSFPVNFCGRPTNPVKSQKLPHLILP